MSFFLCSRHLLTMISIRSKNMFSRSSLDSSLCFENCWIGSNGLKRSRNRTLGWISFKKMTLGITAKHLLIRVPPVQERWWSVPISKRELFKSVISGRFYRYQSPTSRLCIPQAGWLCLWHYVYPVYVFLTEANTSNFERNEKQQPRTLSFIWRALTL